MTFVHEDLEVQKCALQTPKRGYATASETTTAQRPCATNLSATIFKDENRDHLFPLGSKKFPLGVSPASTASTASSPAGFNDIWDLPETPTKRASGTSPRGILTPVTPITPPDSSRKLNDAPIPKPLFGVRESLEAQQPVSDITEAVSPDDSFLPKLFRGVTLVLQEISKENAASAGMKYSINPSFVFTEDTSVSTRTRSKTGATASVPPAIPISVNEEISSVRSSQPYINPPLQSKLAKLLEQLIPHDIHARLASIPGYCVASLVTNPSKRCSYKAQPQRSRAECDGVVENMAKCKSRKDYHGMLRHIKTIVKSVMCNRHQESALVQFKAGSRISQLRSRLEDVTNMSDLDRSTLAQWVDAICDLDVPKHNAARLTTIASSSKPTTHLVRTSKLVYKASTPERIARFSPSSGFMPYQPKKVQGVTVFSALYEKAVSQLGPADERPGFIYLFWDKAYFGMVKIGHTKDLVKRLEQWNTECKRKHDYHSSTESQVEMPHVHRVEQLIHTELKECRLRRRCDGCGKLHKEWFEANQVHVVKVMKKWREWILQKPYVQDEESGTWVLKPEMLDSLEQMCKPLPLDVATQKLRRNSGGTKRSPQRRRSPRRTM